MHIYQVFWFRFRLTRTVSNLKMKSASFANNSCLRNYCCLKMISTNSFKEHIKEVICQIGCGKMRASVRDKCKHKHKHSIQTQMMNHVLPSLNLFYGFLGPRSNIVNVRQKNGENVKEKLEVTSCVNSFCARILFRQNKHLKHIFVT